MRGLRNVLVDSWRTFGSPSAKHFARLFITPIASLGISVALTAAPLGGPFGEERIHALFEIRAAIAEADQIVSCRKILQRDAPYGLFGGAHCQRRVTEKPAAHLRELGLYIRGAPDAHRHNSGGRLH